MQHSWLIDQADEAAPQSCLDPALQIQQQSHSSEHHHQQQHQRQNCCCHQSYHCGEHNDGQHHEYCDQYCYPRLWPTPWGPQAPHLAQDGAPLVPFDLMVWQVGTAVWQCSMVAEEAGLAGGWPCQEKPRSLALPAHPALRSKLTSSAQRCSQAGHSACSQCSQD